MPDRLSSMIMMFIKIAFLTICTLSMKPSSSPKPYVTAYIEEFKLLAIDEMQRSGIPASITMAQAILESNAGQSTLSRQSNNHFGIKCKEYWEGQTYFHPDDDLDVNGRLIPSCFRKYPSIAASYEDHSAFLMTSPKYSHLFTFDKTAYADWAEGLEICGYASDENYAEKLIRTIELYELHELDYYTVHYIEKEDLQRIQNAILSTH